MNKVKNILKHLLTEFLLVTTIACGDSTGNVGPLIQQVPTVAFTLKGKVIERGEILDLAALVGKQGVTLNELLRIEVEAIENLTGDTAERIGYKVGDQILAHFECSAQNIIVERVPAIPIYRSILVTTVSELLVENNQYLFKRLGETKRTQLRALDVGSVFSATNTYPYGSVLPPVSATGEGSASLSNRTICEYDTL